MAIDLDTELALAIAKAESLYGPRDDRFKLLPIRYHAKNYAQSVVDDQAMTVSVRLADSTPFFDKDAEAAFEIWHEAVHCLFPVNRMDTLWFEEGVALRFGLKFAPITPELKTKNQEVMPSPWKEVFKAFRHLNPSDAQIRAIRERAPGKLLDNIDGKMVTDICKVRYRVSAPLFNRLPKDRR